MSKLSVFRTTALLFGILCFDVVRATPLPANFANEPGELEPNSGTGRHDTTIYFPSMRFPLEQGPAFLNSQVYRPGGEHGSAGGQCDSVNYSYPWRDNFCESRNWPVAFCPTGKGHQGQDIRPSACRKDTYWAVAAEDGVIAQVGTFSISLQATNGIIFRYLHLKMDELAVQELDEVKKGDRLGKVSNWFGKTTTTIHLHFDAKGAVRVGDGRVVSYLPPYMSLISSYKKLMGEIPSAISK
jgi:murein DD-endopeptidase MepM/ murein hydrolase activator NlpD